MNGHLMSFHRRTTNSTHIISTQDKQNERLSYGLSTTGTKVKLMTFDTKIFPVLQDKQNKCLFYHRFSSTGSKVRTNNTNHFYFSKQAKWMVIL